MTAPDPGLTDLIAAHDGYGYVPGYPPIYYCMGDDCKAKFSAPREWAEHLKFVVEQHTNGRITELNWDALVAAIPDGWELRESAQLEEVSRVRQRDLEASQATTARWRARAEKAEATIARVDKLQRDLFQQGGNLIAQWGAARLIRAALQEEFIRAALEGEQQ